MIAPTNELRPLEARVVLYQHLSMAFLEPSEELAGMVSDGTFLAHLTMARAALEADAHDDAFTVPTDLASVTLEDLRAQYRSTFETPECAPYETHHITPQVFLDAHVLADIAAFYSAFGFEISPELRIRPDHMSVQLEFLYLLVLKEAYALTNGLGESPALVARDARSKFLSDHVGRWMPRFCEQLAERFPHTFYGRIAAVLQSYLLFECARSVRVIGEAKTP